MIKSVAILLFLTGLFVAEVSTTRADEPKTKTATAKTTMPLHATLSKGPGGAETSTFGADQPEINLHFQGETLLKGDKIRVTWTVVDAGKAVTKNKQVYEFTQLANSAQANGNFQLAKPASGWPLGKYRADIYVNGARVQTLPFAIK